MDIPLLYMPVTDEAIENAYTFYGIWYEAPGAVKVGLPLSTTTPLAPFSLGNTMIFGIPRRYE